MNTSEQGCESSPNPSEAEFSALIESSRCPTILPEDCDEGYLYWGTSRRIGELGICRGFNESGEMQFEGLREKLGEDLLFIEFHWDSSDAFGTFIPEMRLEKVPNNLSDESSVMTWLLDRELEVDQLRVDWLKGIPARFKELEEYKWRLDDALIALQCAERTRTDGFSFEPTLTFRKIMEAARQAKET